MELKKYLTKCPPYMGGGEMIKEVYEDHFIPADVPEKFEAGTPRATVIGMAQ